MKKGNVLKDYVSIASYFHVSHLCILTRTVVSPYLKICKIPRGPTLTFRILNYSLARDVLSRLRKQVKTKYIKSKRRCIVFEWSQQLTICLLYHRSHLKHNFFINRCLLWITFRRNHKLWIWFQKPFRICSPRLMLIRFGFRKSDAFCCWTILKRMIPSNLDIIQLHSKRQEFQRQWKEFWLVKMAKFQILVAVLT